MSARAVAALVALALVACGDNDPLPAETQTVEVASMPGMPVPQLDLLFQIDDSISADVENSLGHDIESLLTPLAAAAGVTDLRVGVITSDLGTSGGPPIGQVGNGGCAGAGKDGALQTSGAQITGRYLIDAPGAQNFTGDRHEALDRMMKVGAGGCGFEQPLAATQRAFENPVNAGFLRPDANLLLLLVSDEDDCSIRDPELLDPAADLGPLQSYRCTAQGVSCDEPLTEVGDKHHCRAAVSSPYVQPVEPYIARFAALKPDRARLTVAAIAGPPEPFSVTLSAPPGGGTPILTLARSCTWQGNGGPNNITSADPAVRLAQVVAAFGANGTVASVCNLDLTPMLTRVARTAKQMFGVACLDTTELRDPLACEAVEVRDDIESPLAFELVADPAACPETADHIRLVPDFATPPTATTYVRARCALAQHDR